MDQIYKLQPHRTMHLQGFDGYGCTASMHHASDAGFKISGVWGEQDDFVVLVLWDADNNFEHPRMRYLPDTAFDGISLAFDLTTSNCVKIESDLYPWIDWAFLNVTFTDGTNQQIRLSDYATGTGAYTNATVGFDLNGTPAGGDYIELAWFDQHFNVQVYGGETADAALGRLASAINGGFSTGMAHASASGTHITLTWNGVAIGKGANANRIGVYGMVHGTGTESWAPQGAMFSGGVSPDTYHVSLDFSSVLTKTVSGGTVPKQVQKMWLTFAPPIQSGATFTRAPFSVVVANWAVGDANGKRQLKVAGPGSVRIEEDNPWVVRAGYWEDAPTDGFAFWSQGRAIRSAYSAWEVRTLTVETHCQSTHDIYVGTRLDTNCGIISATLDGGSAVTLDCYGAATQIRRRLFAGVAAGKHSVVITCTSPINPLSMGWYFYFDYLECAVRTDVPDAIETRTDVGVATDYDTDNTYKLSPQRLLWNLQKLGLVGEVDHYAGVFWWPVRKMLTAPSTWSQQTVITFSGAPTWGQTFNLVLGRTTISHMCLIGETLGTVALAFAQLINQGSTVFWAEVSGPVLTLHGLAGSANYHIAISAPSAAGLTATVATTNPTTVAVTWGVDDTATSPVNTAVADWCADWFAAAKAAGVGVTVSFSQELVNPPATWIQKFHDGTPASTATGFGTLSSSQCNFSAAMQTFMKAAYKQMAGLMITAGLPARLQFGEVGWWFNSGGTPQSMAYYDADTQAAFGGTLHTFLTPNDDPSVNSYADANFLRARLKNYVDGIRTYVLATYSGALFEILWPLDVNDPDTRRLNHYVNLPTEWTARASSGFDTFMVEGFQYAGVDHNIDKAQRCAGYPFTELAWDRAHCRYLFGMYYAGWPWGREYLAARSTAVPMEKIWAYDHLCLFGWTLPLPTEARRSVVTTN